MSAPPSRRALMLFAWILAPTTIPAAVMKIAVCSTISRCAQPVGINEHFEIDSNE